MVTWPWSGKFFLDQCYSLYFDGFIIPLLPPIGVEKKGETKFGLVRFGSGIVVGFYSHIQKQNVSNCFCYRFFFLFHRFDREVIISFFSSAISMSGWKEKMMIDCFWIDLASCWSPIRNQKKKKMVSFFSSLFVIVMISDTWWHLYCTVFEDIGWRQAVYLPHRLRMLLEILSLNSCPTRKYDKCAQWQNFITPYLKTLNDGKQCIYRTLYVTLLEILSLNSCPTRKCSR